MAMRDSKYRGADDSNSQRSPATPLLAVELFAGIGGFRVGSERVGVKTVWANDWCPKACRVYADRFGVDSIVCGDINTHLDSIPSHDVLTAGFPCQPFSSAGKKKGIQDPRGTLFSVVVDVLKKHRPRYFILENVKRLLTMQQGLHFATILASLAELNYFIEWRLVNAADLGLPQNRQRVIIVGVRDDRHPTADGESPSAPVVRLTNRDDFRDLRVDSFSASRMENWASIESHGRRFPSWGLARGKRFFGVQLGALAGQCPASLLRDVLQAEVADDFDFTESTKERIKASKHVRRFVHGVEILSNQAGGARMGYTVFGASGLAPTLTSTASRHYERYKIGDRYRRLTNVEYARIQGFADEHCSSASVYDQYSLYGNAVPPVMAEWAFRRLQGSPTPISKLFGLESQRRLFADA